MSGPYNLKYIHLFVTEVSPGAFILSRNGRMADRVGRADENLAQDLHRAAGEGKYRYFWFEYTGRAAGAHELECAWYHRYHPTDNVDHPTAPLNGAIRCSIKGCSDVLASARG
ncbi:MAG TPA: hypothetical protein VGJ57_02590 [Nitrospirales bacterium]|jgi:hypothetical protein